MNKISLLFISILAMLMIFGCGKNKPLPGSYERIIGNVEGALADTILTLETGYEKSYSKFVETTDALNLLLGNYEQYKSGIFINFSDVSDSVIIDSAKLMLNIKDRIAPGDTTFWDISHEAIVNVYLADTTWDQSNPPLGDPGLLLSTTTIYSDSLDTLSINLNAELVNRWVEQGSIYNYYGIWLESSDTDFMQIYYSVDYVDAAIIPRLNLYYHDKDSTGSDITSSKVKYASEDNFVLLNNELDLNLDPNLIYVGKGLAFYNNLNFDFSLFDTTIHINRAILELTINKEYSIRDLSGLSDANLYRQAVEWVDGTEIDQTDGLGTSYPPTVTDSSITFSIAPSIQAISTNTYENYGFFFKLTSEDQTISRIAFYSSKSDFELQPKIKIYYSTPAKQEF